MRGLIDRANIDLIGEKEGRMYDLVNLSLIGGSEVISGTAAATPVGINPYVSFTASASTVTAGTPGVLLTTTPIVVGPVVDARGKLTIAVAPPLPSARTKAQEEAADRERSRLLKDDWLNELEQFARANWTNLVG